MCREVARDLRPLMMHQPCDSSPERMTTLYVPTSYHRCIYVYTWRWKARRMRSMARMVEMAVGRLGTGRLVAPGASYLLVMFDHVRIFADTEGSCLPELNRTDP